MLPYHHFTLDERKYLQKLLAEGYSIRKAAYALDKSPSSVSREIARNRSKYRSRKATDNRFNYHHWRAQTLYIMRRRQSQHYRIQSDTPEYTYIVKKLNLLWSPDEIANRWKMDYPDARTFAVSTIYRAIKRGYFPGIREKTHLRRKGKIRCTSREECRTIHPDRTIPQWPEWIRNRSRIGDWEGDTVYGGVGKGALVTLVDRKTRFLCSRVIPNRSASVTREAIVEAVKGLPVRSISLDNGSEFSEFHELEQDLSTLVYFAEPHKPWQRGTNENTNDLLRFFFPKGYDFRTVTQEDLQEVVDLINHRPRKCLGYRTPFEAFCR